MAHPRSRPKALAVFAATSAVVALAPAVATAGRRVPFGFWGANWDGHVIHSRAKTQDKLWARMPTAGVESQRATFIWAAAQREQHGPFDFARTDALVKRAVTNGIELLPVVAAAPRWARENESVNAPPTAANRSAYADYLRALIGRYGPAGTFWLENPLLPRRPIRAWQIWNEPSERYQWSIPSGVDWAPGYGALVRTVYPAVKDADPGARVVLAGLPSHSDASLAHLYDVGHVHGYFDIGAVHPYSAVKGGVLTLVKRFRKVMDDHGDANKELRVTEVGLPASEHSGDRHQLETDDAGMAAFLQRSYADLTKNRGRLKLTRVYWYTWASSYRGWYFNWTGLMRYRHTHGKDGLATKPALKRYRKLALRAEGR